MAGGCSRREFLRGAGAAVVAIREVSPQRTIVVDGMEWGSVAATELGDLGVVHGARAYAPFCLTHYRASWANTQECPEPTWPGEGWDRERLGEHYRTWRELVRQGQALMCCEGGAYNKTRHEVLLGWLGDVLEVLGEAGIGFALWNFRGSFGVLDSGREDVTYEEFGGHKLDRELLELMQGYARKVGARPVGGG